MNRDTMERWVLLKQSGELGRWRGWILARRLARDRDLRDFAQDAADLGLASRSRAPGCLPDNLIHAIHDRLSESTDRRAFFTVEPETGWRPGWKFAAAACAVALAAAVVYVLRPGDPGLLASDPASAPAVEQLAWNDSLDAALDEVDAWLAGRPAEEAGASDTEGPTSEEELLIRELLALEGIAI